MAFSLRTRACSEIGLVRKNNQDSGYFSPTLLLVADGMGGAAAGDLASAVAVTCIKKADRHLEGTDMLTELAGALSKANDQLADLVEWNHLFEGMGTTVTGAMFSGTQFGLIHIGDSRSYLLRDGKLTRLTTDHSWVQSLVDDGKIDASEASHHPNRSLLLKVLNGQPTHSPDVKLVDAHLGDRIMFCSDGLAGLVDESIIEQILTDSSLDDALDQLVEAAYDCGASDNITIVVSDVVEFDPTLELLPPTLLGAAATVEIPKIPDPFIDSEDDSLSDSPDESTGEEERYTPVIQKKRHLWPLVISLSVALGLLTAGFFGGRAYLDAQFFIGSDQGYVSINRGIPDRPLGISLSKLELTTQISVSDLPPYYAKAVREKTLRPKSLDAARTSVSELEHKTKLCLAIRANHSVEESAKPSITKESPKPSASGPAPEPPTATSSASGGKPAQPNSSPSSSSELASDDPEACS